MGSGVNLKLQETAPAAKPAPASAAQGTQPQGAQPQSSQGTQPQPQGSQAQGDKQENQNKQVQQDAAAGKEKKDEEKRFAVQVASYRDKGEAEAAQAKLAAKGIPAYLVESKLADKSVWYRLRVGRSLSKSEAGQLAAKAGKGAVLIPE